MSWASSGCRAAHIVFSVWRDSLYKVPATGGTPTVHLAVNPAAEIDFHQVTALPGDRLLVAAHQRQSDFDIVELVDGQQRIVISTDKTANLFEYAAPGWLLVPRASR